jgi:hypothetical protein
MSVPRAPACDPVSGGRRVGPGLSQRPCWRLPSVTVLPVQLVIAQEPQARTVWPATMRVALADGYRHERDLSNRREHDCPWAHHC